MRNTFKRGADVYYTTPRGGQSGRGKIKAIHETTRGLRYEVEDSVSKARVRVRAAGLDPA